MNLNKMFVFIFVFFLMFSALLVTMPSDFKLLGIGASVEEKEVAEYFSANNVTIYNNTKSFNLTEGDEYQFYFGLGEDEKIEFWWNYGLLEVRHLSKVFFGWWWSWHVLRILEPWASMADVGSAYGTLDKEGLLLLFNEDYNASYWECSCEHIMLKIFCMTYNQSWTLSESWDNDKLKFMISYNIDWEATGTSMWGVMGRLMSFQNPDLGIPGLGGTLLNIGVGGAMWACVVILFFALITAVIPWISGWKGGD